MPLWLELSIKWFWIYYGAMVFFLWAYALWRSKHMSLWQIIKWGLSSPFVYLFTVVTMPFFAFIAVLKTLEDHDRKTDYDRLF